MKTEKDSLRTGYVRPVIRWVNYEINGTMHFFEQPFLAMGHAVLSNHYQLAGLENAKEIPVICVPCEDLKSLQDKAYAAWWNARESGQGNAKTFINEALRAVGICEYKLENNGWHTPQPSSS